MDPKRELASVDLAALVGELSVIQGARFRKAYLHPGKALFRFKLRDFDRGRQDLLCQVGEWKRLHLVAQADVPTAPDRPPNFAKMLRNALGGTTLDSIEQVGFDRIVEFEFSRDDEAITVVAELFGDGNLVVIDDEGTITDCLRTVQLQSRTVRPGGSYEPPAARVNPLELSREAFHEEMADSTTDLVRTLATQLNFGGLYAEELCSRADVPKERSIETADTEDFDAIYEDLRTLADTLASGSLTPTVYADDTGVVDVAPVPLLERSDFEAETFQTMSEAVATYFDRLSERGEDDSETAAGEERARLERIIEQQEQAIEEYAAEADRHRRMAEALYANYDLVDELLRAIREARSSGYDWEAIEDRLDAGADSGIPAAEIVSAVDATDEELTLDLAGESIPVDPQTDVEHNADRLYSAAKEIEDKRSGAKDAVAETRTELAALEDETSTPAPDQSTTGDPDWLSRTSIPIKRPDHWYEQFRWFHSSDEFLVIGGRSAKQNEELVKKYVEPTDRILHSQAHGGPITIVKATAPDEPATTVEFPDRTLEEAAQFAVSYSSVWRDGRYAGDAYAVDPEQVTKNPESGEFLETGSFAIRGERDYFRDVPVGIAIGITCEPETRVIGGPPDPVQTRAETDIRLEPGRFAKNDVATRIYRRFQERFADESFVRSVADTDELQRFLPPGGSRIVEGSDS